MDKVKLDRKTREQIRQDNERVHEIITNYINDHMSGDQTVTKKSLETRRHKDLVLTVQWSVWESLGAKRG